MVNFFRLISAVNKETKQSADHTVPMAHTEIKIIFEMLLLSESSASIVSVDVILLTTAFFIISSPIFVTLNFDFAKLRKAQL